MTYPYPAPPPLPQKPNKRKRTLLIALVAVGVLLLLGLCGGILSGATGSTAHHGSLGKAVAPAAQPVATDAPAPAATPTPAALTAADIKLKIKTTTKDCFGSAGCNVEYTIDAAWSPEGGECDVTYEVHGLEDAQIGTLNLHADGTYEQDSYQSGQTSSSSRKLSVKVTDVVCNVIR